MKRCKTIGILLMATLLSSGCNSQENKSKKEANPKEVETETPKGSWKVNREFDKDGNLVRYDSIYSWSSSRTMNELATLDRDSILKSMKSKFYNNFSQFDFEKEGFGDMFEEDSLFTKHLFNDEFFENQFGQDFMDLNQMHERMQAMQKQFLEQYQPMIEPKKEESEKQN